MTTPDVLTPEEAARILGVSRKTLRRLPIKKARLSPRKWVVLREDLLAYLRGKAL